jgi:hypothetical protein
MLYDDGEAVAEPCPKCRSTKTYEVTSTGSWKCEECSTIWVFEDESAFGLSDKEPYILWGRQDTVNVSGLEFEV